MVRDGDKLFGLRLAAPVVKSFRYHFDSKTIDQPKQSEFSKDLMKLILDDAGDAIRQKLAMPSAWSDLTLSANFNLRGEDRAPKIKRLDFSMTVSAIKAPRQIVLEAHASDGCSPITMDGTPYAEIYRVERSATTVVLDVDPKPVNGAQFRQWTVRQGGQPRVEKGAKLTLDLKTHARVEAQFDRT